MSYVKHLVMSLFLCFVFIFLGGYMLFDFSNNVFLATASCSVVVAMVTYAFDMQGRKIQLLEMKIKDLEKEIGKN